MHALTPLLLQGDCLGGGREARGTGQPAEQKLPGHKRCTGGDSIFPLAAVCVFTEPAAACQESGAFFHVFYQICQFSKGS